MTFKFEGWHVAIIIAIVAIFLVVFPTFNREMIVPTPGRTESISQYLDEEGRASLISLSRMTMVGGATCSTDHDEQDFFVPAIGGKTQICKTNTDHTGIAWVLYEWKVGVGGINQSGFYGAGSKLIKIVRGDTECFTGTVGKTYLWEFYYCDDSSVTTCKDSDGGVKSTTYGTTTVTQSGQSQIWEDACSGGVLLERYCDSDNTQQTAQITCSGVSSNYVCQNGACKSSTTTTTGGVSGCNTADYKKCYANHVYWYNCEGTKLGRYDYCDPLKDESCIKVSSTLAQCKCAATCSSKGIECGTSMVCGVQKDCGTCGTGEKCKLNKCVTIASSTTYEDEDEDEEDAEPTSSSACTRNADCGTGEVCTNGRCAMSEPVVENGEGSSGCTQDSDCEEGEACSEGLCVIPGEGNETIAGGIAGTPEQIAEQKSAAMEEDQKAKQQKLLLITAAIVGVILLVKYGKKKKKK